MTLLAIILGKLHDFIEMSKLEEHFNLAPWRKKSFPKVCYRVWDRSENGWSEHDTLEQLDAYLIRVMEGGTKFCPIKRIVKVTSEEVPFTETVRKYNEWTAGDPHIKE